MWKSPPTRQLSREKRLEYECDIRERFYDDYIGQRNSKPTPAFLQSDLTVRLLFLLAAGDVGTDVLTGVHHLKFDPAIYRANALQGLMHDPARKRTKLRRSRSNSSRDYILFSPSGVVPSGVDFGAALKAERTRERQRHIEEQRRRRLSDSHV